MVLRDSFIGIHQGKVTVGMIACVSPGYSHADHSLNTIRYAERLKEFPPLSHYAKVAKSCGIAPTPIQKENPKTRDIGSKKVKERERQKWTKPKRKEEHKEEEPEEEIDEEAKMKTRMAQHEDFEYLMKSL